jgi:hypothetical protein
MMTNQMVRTHMNDVNNFLTITVTELNDYLDGHHLEGLLREDGSKNQLYYKDLLKALRRLEVICDEALDAVKKNIRTDCMQEHLAKKTLRGIYHRCVLEFYFPKNDSWYENSRASYNGDDSIHFRNDPPASIKDLINQLDQSFQSVREQLVYYDNEHDQATVMPIREQNSTASK